MKVNVGDSLYEMGNEQFKGVLKIASKAIPFGIYAMKGFKVYYNEESNNSI